MSKPNMTTSHETLARPTFVRRRHMYLTMMAIMLGMQMTACGPESELEARDETNASAAAQPLTTEAETEAKTERDAAPGDDAPRAELPPKGPPPLVDSSGPTANAVFGCGQYTPPGHWGMCGSLFMGETWLRIRNPNSTIVWAWVEYLQEWVGIHPYSEFLLIRWFWGANQYVYNWEWNPGPIVVSH
jgi:hypothetical protein